MQQTLPDPPNVPIGPRAIDPFAGTPEEFTEDMWKEFAANWRSGGESVFNKRSGEASLSGFVPARCLEAAIRFMIGYEQIRTVPWFSHDPEKPRVLADVYALRRKNPIRHPYFKNLWCTGVGEQEFKPLRTGSAGPVLKLPTEPVPFKTPPALANRTGYQLAKLVLKFSPLDYDVLEDVAPDFGSLSNWGLEYLRNVSVDVQPRVETFESKVKWRYVEGSGLPAGYSSPEGTDALADRAQLIVKPDVVFTLRNFPQDWLCLPGTLMPVNVLAALGCVNHTPGGGTDFFGFPAGTLLLVGAKLTRFPWALRVDQNKPGANLESKYLMDVELACSFFDPVKGYTGNPAVRITTNRGHNNFPYRGTLVAGDPDKNGGLWFLATVAGAAGNGRLFKSAIYEQIFDNPQNVRVVPF